MKLDKTLARLLSNFFLDIAKAFFIATFITPSLGISSLSELLLILTRGVSAAILSLLLAWRLARLEETI